MTDVTASIAGGMLGDNTRIFDIVEAGAVTLDGLILTGGGASAGDASADETDGGEVRSVRTALTIADSRIVGNVTGAAGEFGDGGGVAAIGGALTLSDSVVSGNSTELDGGNGGGVYAGRGAALTIERSVISDNRARSDGGGITVKNGSQFTMTDTTVSGNYASVNGGGLYLDRVGDATVAGSGALIENSTISGNNAANTGGGIPSNMANVSATGAFTPATVLVNTTIADNVAVSRAGGLYNSNGAMELRSSTVTGNRGRDYTADGVASKNDAATRTTVVSSIIAGNDDTDLASGFFINTFVSGGGNVIGTGAETATGNITDAFSAHSDIVGATAADVFAAVNGTTGGGVLADNGGPVETVALSATSPAIGRAVASGPATDARGVPRDVDPDTGAFEARNPEAGSLVVTTVADVVDAFDGLTSLREAVAFATAQAGADTITFAAGVTALRLDAAKLDITIAEQTLTIDGGPGGVTIDGDADGDGNAATSVAEGGGPAVVSIRHFTLASADVTLQGLTLTGGYTTDAVGGLSANRAGGAVQVLPGAGAALTVRDGAFVGNGAYVTGGGASAGGAIYARAGSLTIENSLFARNKADFKGGAVRTTDSLAALTITGSTFADNISGDDGGALYGGRGQAIRIADSAFIGNRADGGGGGADLLASGSGAGPSVTLENVTFAGNVAGADGEGYGEGGGLNVRGPGATTLQSLTLTGNLADRGGGLWVGSQGNVTLTNSIVAGNASRLDAPSDADLAAVGGSFPGALTSGGGNVVGVAGPLALLGSDVGGATAAQLFAQTATIPTTAVTGGVAADNGGPVATVALRLANDNPVLGLALAGGPAADARSAARDAAPDAGAFEAANPAPMAVGEAAAVDEDGAVAIDVLANDSDVNGGLDPTSVRIEGAAGDGRELVVAGEGVWSVDPASGAISFTPAPDYDGAVTAIAYTVADTLGARSEAASVSVEIMPVADASITFEYVVAREITGIRAVNGRPAYRTAEFSGARNDIAFEDLVFDTRPDPARVGDVLVGGTSNVRFREFFAVLNEGGDKDRLDAGDRLYRVSNSDNSDRLTTIPATNQCKDVVTIRASGAVNNNALGDLSGGIRFGDRGFGVDNGPDGDGDARWLNRGDTLVFRLTGADGASDALAVASFTVRTDRASADIGFDADGDGRLLRDTNGGRHDGFVENSDDVFLRGLSDGARIEVDFDKREVRVNGIASTADFRGLFDDPERIGFGASLNGGRWAIDDLTLGLA